MAELQQYYQTPELEQARTESESAQKKAVAYQSASSLLPSKLRQAIMEKTEYNKDIIAEQNKKMAEYFAAPSAAREKYQDIWNPFTREKLVTEERTQAYAPYATLTDILSQRMGNIADIIGQGTGAFQAATTAAQGEASIAQQGYQNALNLAQLLANAAQTEEELRLREAELNKPSGGGSDMGSLLGLLAGLIPGAGGEEPSPTEPKPSGPPSASLRARGITIRSPGAQWYWDPEYNEWIPYGP